MLDPDCSTAYSQGSQLTMDASSPWQISGYQHNPIGFSITICYKCYATYDSSPITKVWTYTQTELDCTTVVSLSNFADSNLLFLSGGSANIGSGYSSFYSISDTNCAVSTCQLL
jgi:hypothetical protein